MHLGLVASIFIGTQSFAYTIECNGINEERGDKTIITQAYADNDVIKQNDPVQAHLEYMSSGLQVLDLNEANNLSSEHYLRLNGSEVKVFNMSMLNYSFEPVVRVEYSADDPSQNKMIAYNVADSGQDISYEGSEVTCTQKK